ncbi:MAG: GntR family transcriptional regulator [Lachnospiraceae bacterium]
MEREALYQGIFQDLLEAIKQGNYPPGSRLPSEKELAEKYEVSRITSKRALEMLAERNMITRRPGRGSYVLEAPLDDPDGPVGKEKESKKSIGVIFDSLGAEYGCEILKGIERECSRKEYNIIFSCTYGSVSNEIKAIDSALDAGASGIICMCAQGEVYNSKILQLAGIHYPMVLVDREMRGIPITCVKTDNYTAAKELTETLIAKGHTKIGFISHHAMQTRTIEERLRGFIDCHMEHNLITNEAMWLTSLNSSLPNPDEDDSDAGMDFDKIDRFIGGHPQITAIFAVEYKIGVMVYKVLKKRNMEREKTIVFFDGVDEIYDTRPIFTRVQQDEYLMGVIAAKELDTLITGKNTQPVNKLIPYKIIDPEL